MEALTPTQICSSVEQRCLSPVTLTYKWQTMHSHCNSVTQHTYCMPAETPSSHIWRRTEPPVLSCCSYTSRKAWASAKNESTCWTVHLIRAIFPHASVFYPALWFIGTSFSEGWTVGQQSDCFKCVLVCMFLATPWWSKSSQHGTTVLMCLRRVCM